MNGNTTLVELYLGVEPTGITTDNDRLLVHLSDGRAIALPLEFVSQLEHVIPPTSTETRLLILSQPPRIDTVRVTENTLTVILQDGRVLSSPLGWFPRLRYASQTERTNFQIIGDDDVIHWPELDEDIELLRLFSGGASLESERSVKQWQAERMQKSLVLQEPPQNYGTGEE